MSVIGELETKTFQFTWKIHNFSKTGEKFDDSFYSPYFKIGDPGNESEWIMMCYPYGDRVTAKNYFSLYIRPTFADDLQLKSYLFKLSLIDNDGNNRLECSTKLLELNRPTLWTGGWFYKRDILMSLKDTLLPNDTLKICCSVTLNPYSKEEVDKDKIMIENYETLYSTASLSDLTIKIGAKKIKAHKSILSVRSKVFSAMFQHDMSEQNTNSIEIVDVDYETMMELLSFLYCGKVKNIKKLAKPLLIAADKYDINSLKMICERTLFENLEVEVACETLVIADRFNCTKLKSETIHFVIKNIKAIISTTKFKELKVSNADLLEEILCKMAEHY